MKKFILAGALALFGLSNAQMTKGDWTFSGNTGFSFNNTTQVQSVNTSLVLPQDGPETSSVTFTPSFGYFVIDRLAIGIDADLNSTRTKMYVGDIHIKTTASGITVLPTATYYFSNATKFVPYLGAGAGFGTIRSKYSTAENNVAVFSQDDTANGFTWKIKGGINYMITPFFAVNAGLSFNQLTTKQDIDYSDLELKNRYNNFGVNAGFSFFIRGKARKSDK